MLKNLTLDSAYFNAGSQGNKVSISPNPIDENSKLSFTATYLEKITVEIYNVNWKLIKALHHDTQARNN